MRRDRKPDAGADLNHLVDPDGAGHGVARRIGGRKSPLADRHRHHQRELDRLRRRPSSRAAPAAPLASRLAISRTHPLGAAAADPRPVDLAEAVEFEKRKRHDSPDLRAARL